MELEINELREFLDSKVLLYNTKSFIEPDPISVPHRYILKEDIEIAGFLASTIAWGNRKMIVKYSHQMLDYLGDSPYDFVMNYNNYNIDKLDSFVYRTFNANDFKQFIKSLHNIYTYHGGLETIFTNYQDEHSLQFAIHKLKSYFFEIEHLTRTEKHIADPLKGSSAKRINLFLRWMIRKDKAGVDFGIWKNIDQSKLSCPLDVHSGNVARKLGLLSRNQNDAFSVKELDLNLRLLDAKDPVKYDFALFGLGIFEHF